MEQEVTEFSTIRRWLPWAAGAAVALAGAGGLIILWQVLPWPDDQLTWPDYRSGSFGDAVLLPTMTATLIQLNQRAQPPIGATRASRHRVGLAALAGGIGGLAVQLLWLADPAPSRSWTFTQPHHFSIAGTWHAVFFTAMAALIAALWTSLLLRWTRLRRTPQHLLAAADSEALTWFTASAFGFSVLVLLDSMQAPAALASTASIVGVGAAAASVIALGFWPLRSVLRSLTPRLLPGLLAAAALITASTTWPPTPQAMILAALAIGAARGWTSCHSRSVRAVQEARRKGEMMDSKSYLDSHLPPH